MIVIGLAGRAGSGKSTCGEWLRREYGARLFSLADPLKRLAMDVFGFTEAQVFGTQADKEAVDPHWNLSPREALIRMGNAARERLDADVWVRACMASIEQSSAPLSVVTDVRYPNEAEAIMLGGGYVIRLRCPDAATNVNPNAPSERSVDDIREDFVYANINVPRSSGAFLLISAFAEVVRPLLDQNGQA